MEKAKKLAHPQQAAYDNAVVERRTPIDPAIPNSALLQMIEQAETKQGDSERLRATMEQRIGSVIKKPSTQLPRAEKEAETLARSISPIGSPEQVKEAMGRRLGADFSDVVFHTDRSTARRTDAMGADAYASGRDIYFGSGGFDPSAAAHELVHTVQQGAVEGSVNVSAPMGSVQMIWNPFKAIKNFFTGDKKKSEPKTGEQKKPFSSVPTVSEDVNNELKARLGQKPVEKVEKPTVVPPEITAPEDYSRVSQAKARVDELKNVVPETNVRMRLRQMEEQKAALENLLDVATEYLQTSKNVNGLSLAKFDISQAKSQLKSLAPSLKKQQQDEIAKSKDRKMMTLGDKKNRRLEGLQKTSVMGGVSKLIRDGKKKNYKDEKVEKMQYFKKGHTLSVESNNIEKYTDRKTGKEIQRPGYAFKRVTDKDDKEVNDDLLGIMGLAGITPEVKGGKSPIGKEGTLDTEKREVAVSVVASLLGMGGVIAQSRFGNVKDKEGNSTSGVIIEEAVGASPMSVLNTQGVYVREGLDMWSRTEQKGESQIKSVNSVVQRDLMSMTLFDSLCAQADRHSGNMGFKGLNIKKDDNNQQTLVGDTVESVTGFDQDLSFGSVDMQTNTSREGASRCVDEKGNLTLPFLDKKMARRVLALKPNDLRAALKGLLPEKDIDAAVKRLKTTQSAIEKEMKNPTGKLLDDDEWGEETHNLILGEFGKKQETEKYFQGGFMRPGLNVSKMRDLNQYQKTVGNFARAGMLSDDLKIEGIGGGSGKLSPTTKANMEKAKKKKK